MTEQLRSKIQEEFSDCYSFWEIARLYFDIRCECEKQVEYMSLRVAKEMKEDGVLDEGGLDGR